MLHAVSVTHQDNGVLRLTRPRIDENGTATRINFHRCKSLCMVRCPIRASCFRTHRHGPICGGGAFICGSDRPGFRVWLAHSSRVCVMDTQRCARQVQGGVRMGGAWIWNGQNGWSAMMDQLDHRRVRRGETTCDSVLSSKWRLSLGVVAHSAMLSIGWAIVPRIRSDTVARQWQHHRVPRIGQTVQSLHAWSMPHESCFGQSVTLLLQSSTTGQARGLQLGNPTHTD